MKILFQIQSHNRVIWLLFTILLGSGCLAQEEWGGKLGLSFQFGTHLQRIGIMYQTYYFNQSAHFSNGLQLNYNLKSLGPKKDHFEIQLNAGIQAQWNDIDETKFLIDETSNMAPFRSSLGYTFYWYLDNRETSQTAGAFYSTLEGFTFYMANDAFGFNQIDDQFRTGGFYLGYQHDSTKYGGQITLWTGRSSEGERVDDTSYPSRFGYRDVSKSKYGLFSHGIMAIRLDQYLIYGQSARAELGFDSERLRHILQNKLVHDGISKRLVKSESPHYPMISRENDLYLFRPNQKIKRTGLFFQLASNQNILY